MIYSKIKDTWLDYRSAKKLIGSRFLEVHVPWRKRPLLLDMKIYLWEKYGLSGLELDKLGKFLSDITG